MYPLLTCVSVVVYMFLLPGLRLPRLKKWLERKRLPGSGREDSGTTSLQPPEQVGQISGPLGSFAEDGGLVQKDPY